MEKDFEGWHKLKPNLDANRKTPTFQEREIWWCSIGINIGNEENGKSEMFSRPVLIIRKFNNVIFWGVPLTTIIKDSQYYYKISFQGRDVCVMLSQLKMLDSKRLTTKMGQLTIEQAKNVGKVLRNLIP